MLQPSDNLDFEDLYITAMGSQAYGIQVAGSNTYERVVINGVETTASIQAGANKTVKLINCIMKFLRTFSSDSNSIFDCENILTFERSVIQGNPSLLIFKNGIATANDWLLGRGTYVGSETLINYSYFKEDAPASDFGPGSDNNTVNYDPTNDFVDFSGGDYRIKSNSPLATAGEGGTFVGAFLEAGGVTFRQSWITNYSGVVNL
jgi:hypothetical protein